MILRKCLECGGYALEEKCGCGGKTESGHYKFVKIRDVRENLRKSN